MIYAVTRRYTVEDVVYVEADSPSEAKAKAADCDYIEQTDQDTVSPTTHRKAEPRPNAHIEYGDLVFG